MAENNGNEFSNDRSAAACIPEYGDLTLQNSDRTILDSVGHEELASIVTDFMDLLHSSSAVYERNGDYALGIFSSSWCRCLDTASRRLCATDDNKNALASGKWLCHESCWNAASKKAIEQKAPVDVECNGGLRLYAIPILIEDEVVGAINFGYGAPPRDPKKLKAIADQYHTDARELESLSKKATVADAATVELAKKRLATTAMLIARIVQVRRIEQQARENETRIRSLSDNLTAGLVYQIDSGIDGTDRRFTYISAGVVALHEVTVSAALENSGVIYSQIHADDRAVVAQREQQAAASMTPFNAEVRVRLPSGSERWRHFSSSPRRLPDGHLVWDGIEIDITDRKTAEIALIEERQRLHFIMQATHTGIDILDADFNLLYVDPLWQKTYGDPAGRKCHDYFMGLASPCEGCGVPRALHDREMVVAEHFLPKENRHILVHTIPFADPAGTWLVAEFNVDITERKRMEDALNNVQKLESLGLLAGGIAHDFNNLMSGVFGYIDIASNICRDPEVSGFLDKAMRSLDRARGLTGQLLTFAKGGEPVRAAGPLFPFIQETANFALSGSNVACRFDIAGDVWQSNFDKNQIGQVIDNLVINAQQAMPLGGQIEIAACNRTLAEKEHPLLPAGRYIAIRVKDHGTGIPREHLPRIFDPFFTTKSKGHGLGLATSYSIIKRHGGSIDVDSTPGTGSIFTVYLPATDHRVPDSCHTAEKNHRGTGLFLVMDDEEVVRESIGSMLTLMGYSVTTKADGQSALAFFEAERKAGRRFAGIILDLTIPGGMGGRETAAQIRKADAQVPLYVASGYADDPIMTHPAGYGFTASICKPFVLHELSALLEGQAGGLAAVEAPSQQP